MRQIADRLGSASHQPFDALDWALWLDSQSHVEHEAAVCCAADPRRVLSRPVAGDTVAVHGEWIRYAPHRTALLGRAADPTDGRWQHGEIVRGRYLADEPATALAEGYGHRAEAVENVHHHQNAATAPSHTDATDGSDDPSHRGRTT